MENPFDSKLGMKPEAKDQADRLDDSAGDEASERDETRLSSFADGDELVDRSVVEPGFEVDHEASFEPIDDSGLRLDQTGRNDTESLRSLDSSKPTIESDSLRPKVGFDSKVERPSEIGKNRSRRDPASTRDDDSTSTSVKDEANVEQDRRDAPSSGVSPTVFWAVFGWALLATLAALWLWWSYGLRSDLEALPDDGTLSKTKIIDPRSPLSNREIIALGSTRRLGDIEVTPTSIEHRTTKLVPSGSSTLPLFILRIKVRNVSKERSFSPTDPAYAKGTGKRLRGMSEFDRFGYVYGYLQSRSNAEDMIFHLQLDAEDRLEGQTHEPIGPGESKEIEFASEEIRQEDLHGEQLWRVRLRMGYNRAGKGVTTVIGVPFNPSTVKASL